MQIIFHSSIHTTFHQRRRICFSSTYFYLRFHYFTFTAELATDLYYTFQWLGTPSCSTKQIIKVKLTKLLTPGWNTNNNKLISSRLYHHVKMKVINKMTYSRFQGTISSSLQKELARVSRSKMRRTVVYKPALTTVWTINSFDTSKLKVSCGEQPVPGCN